MRYQIGDAAKLTHLLLSAFTEVPQPAIENGLHRYLWRHIRFGYAEPLADAFDDVRSGSTGHFLYHKKSGLLFTHVEFGYHQLFLAHLSALHKTDFSRKHVTWNVHQFSTRTRSDNLLMTAWAKGTACLFRPFRTKDALRSDRHSIGKCSNEPPLTISD